MPTEIRGGQIKDETIDSVDIASGSIKAGELSAQSISGQATITSTDTTNDRLLVWDATDSALKQVSIGNLGVTASPAGSDTQIQYNNGRSLGGGAQLLYDDSNHRLGIGSANAPDYTLDVAGNAGLDEFIYHNGDDDTYIRLQDDDITLKAGSKSMIRMIEADSDSEIFFNYGNNDVDITFRGTGNNPGVKFDAANNRVGINGVGSPTYELDVGGNIGLNEYIYHNGDANTYIRFQDDDINMACGGKSMVKMSEQPSTQDIVTINNGNSDVDFRVKGDNQSDLIRTIAEFDLVGIHTSTPGSGLEIAHSISLPVGTLRTGAYSIAEDDFCIVADCNSSAFTLTLPSATDAMAGRIYTIKRMDSGNSGGGNMLTISRNGKNIDNVAGDVLLANLDALVLQCIGADGGWIRIGAFMAPL
jgi:hypothetical protein